MKSKVVGTRDSAALNKAQEEMLRQLAEDEGEDKELAALFSSEFKADIISPKGKCDEDCEMTNVETRNAVEDFFAIVFWGQQQQHHYHPNFLLAASLIISIASVFVRASSFKFLVVVVVVEAANARMLLSMCVVEEAPPTRDKVLDDAVFGSVMFLLPYGFMLLYYLSVLSADRSTSSSTIG
jgi:hypothetical protein